MLDGLIAFIQSFFNPLNWSLNWVNIIEICFIGLILFIFYRKFIQNTQSETLVKGLFFLVFCWIFSEVLILLNLKIIGVFFKTLITLIALSLIVIFQPELRRFLGYLGQPGFIKRTFFQSGTYREASEGDTDILKEVIEAVKYLTKTKTGALIVFKKAMSSMTYSEVGTVINAKISTELILTIFHPNTPLHDGAMVIEGDKIQSAGVLLPLTEDPKLSWKYGTRHRAALGMSEVSDAACLVVSEETGDVSICMDGMLKKYEDLTTLKTDLESILGIKPNENIEEKHKNIFDKLRGK
ncbi:MAG: TIGR00159 family protein [Cyanobacteria bacterium SIG28]|nr:TIGR00159 family protein [Cyanobacteria bacterium SIG28]